jgi:IS1 family transposase
VLIVQFNLQLQALRLYFQNPYFVTKLGPVSRSALENVIVCRPPVEVETKFLFINFPDNGLVKRQLLRIDLSLRTHIWGKGCRSEIRETEVSRKLSLLPSGINGIEEAPCGGIPTVFYSIAEMPMGHVPTATLRTKDVDIGKRIGDIGPLASLQRFFVYSIGLIHFSDAALGGLCCFTRFPRLPANYYECDNSHAYQHPLGGCIPRWRFWCGMLCWFATLVVLYYNRDRAGFPWFLLYNVGLVCIGTLIWATGKVPCEGGHYCSNQPNSIHSGESVTQKDLTSLYFRNTVIDMANVLSTDKQIAIIGALAEGSSIRSIERLTGVHRDTIMRLGVRVRRGCGMLLDSKMQDLDCHYLQFDEIWGFIGKKERHVRVDDDPEMGDVWTYCAIDAETKLVPTFKVGKRNRATTTAFVQDVASRLRNRVQISTDALHGYIEAVEQSFGADVDYGQIVKVYAHDAMQHPERKYSAPSFASAMRRPITGSPDMELVSTSYIERLNATTRLHMRRLTRLTLAFSKKLENFEAAVALHFAYYNFVKRHNSIRCTPAMAAGVERDFWTVGNLLEAAA